MGQLFLSFDSKSPEAHWPGTKWTQITGRFLRMANDVSTGGADSVTLTASQMPSHTHSKNFTSGIMGYVNGGSILRNGVASGSSYRAFTTTKAEDLLWQDGTNATGSAGGGKPFDNRPAFQDVYAWRRTA